MFNDFQKVLQRVIGAVDFHVLVDSGQAVDVARALNNAFLSVLSGTANGSQATEFLLSMTDDEEWGEAASYYARGLDLICAEINALGRKDATFLAKLQKLAVRTDYKAEDVWAVFFPEGMGIKGNESRRCEELRLKRKIDGLHLNSEPLTDPGRQILFTSNVLLTLPFDRDSVDSLSLSEGLKDRIKSAMNEQQQFWYDHPIPLDVSRDANEVLYGLRGMEKALRIEKELGHVGSDARMTCVLSVSVTHPGLAVTAREFLEEELAGSGGLDCIDVYVFTEDDTKRIMDEIIMPLLEYSGDDDLCGLVNNVFGVDGAYGRHYSFLKAIAAFWKVFVNDEIKATFKIDLDQVFPQKELVAETGMSAFEHFKTRLWGAHGTDAWGNRVELGMIAGALVNERDIGKSLFTADAVYPDKKLLPDEYFFYSTLPHAFSTEAELLTRYDSAQLDGINRCIQRVHVTGGTNGILVDSLRRYRPFTPTFFGRAEDQAYILSVLLNEGTRLGYVHEDGLIMRHDKEAFAQEAIESAYIGRAIGDYERILYFSEYANVLTNGDIGLMKDRIDPFTGCFISRLPVTITYLRFSLKASAVISDTPGDAVEFVQEGGRRMLKALDFVGGEKSRLAERYDEEVSGWNAYYDMLEHVQDGMLIKDTFVEGLRIKAMDIISEIKIK